MHLETIRGLFECLGPLIHTAHSRYESLLSWYSFFNHLTAKQGELEHRRVKRLYARTNKIQFSFQIARHERRARLLRKLMKPKTHGRVTRSRAKKPSLSFADSDPLPFTDPTARYHMSSSSRHFENLTTWLGDLQDDPAVIVRSLVYLSV